MPISSNTTRATLLALCLGTSLAPSGAYALNAPQPVVTSQKVEKVLFQNLQGNGSFQNFTVQLEDGTLTAEEFTFEGLTSSSTLFKVDALKMRNVVVTRENETTNIASIDLKNIALDVPKEDADGIAILQAIANSTADSAVISNIEITKENETLFAEEARLENLTKGIIGVISLSNLSFAEEDNAVEVASISAGDVNAGHLLSIVNDAAYGAERNETSAKLLDNLVISGLTVDATDEGGEGRKPSDVAMGLEELRIKEITGKQLLFKPSDIGAVFNNLESKIEDPRTQAYGEWAFVVVSEAIRAAGMDVKNLTLAVDEEDQAVSFSFGLLSFGNGDLVNMAPFALENLSFDLQNQLPVSAALKELSVTDGHYFSEDSLKAFQTEKPDAEAFIEFAKKHRRMYFATSKLNDLKVDVAEMPLVSMPEMTALGDVKDGLWTSTATVPSLTVDMNTVKQLGAPEPIINELGYDMLDFSINVDGKFDTRAKTLGYDKFELALKNGGALNLTFELGNLNEEIIGTLLPEEQIANFMVATINSGSLTYTDNSLVERGLKVAAMLAGASPDQMRAQVVAGASFFALQLGDPAIAQQVSTALSTFFEDPKNLSLRLTPAEPVVIQSLQQTAQEGPAALIRALGAEMLANQ